MAYKLGKQRELKDYYDILGIPKNATPKGIQQAFWRLSRIHHPDVNQQDGADETFKTIVEAYLVLKDPDKRDMLDADIIADFCKVVSASRTPLPTGGKKKAPSEFLRLLRPGHYS